MDHDYESEPLLPSYERSISASKDMPRSPSIKTWVAIINGCVSIYGFTVLKLIAVDYNPTDPTHKAIIARNLDVGITLFGNLILGFFSLYAGLYDENQPASTRMKVFFVLIQAAVLLFTLLSHVVTGKSLQ